MVNHIASGCNNWVVWALPIDKTPALCGLFWASSLCLKNSCQDCCKTRAVSQTYVLMLLMLPIEVQDASPWGLSSCGPSGSIQCIYLGELYFCLFSQFVFSLSSWPLFWFKFCISGQSDNISHSVKGAAGKFSSFKWFWHITTSEQSRIHLTGLSIFIVRYAEI